MGKDDARVRFTDGFVFNRELVAMAATVETLQDYEHSRIFSFKGGQWFHYDLDMVVWSICGVEKPIRTMFSMGREGQIHYTRNQRPYTETIPDAGIGEGKLGYLSRICQVDGALYCCGSSGQIYRRDSGGWVHFDKGVLDPNAIEQEKPMDLLCFDGTAKNDLYAVGQDGLLFHYNGKAWTKLNSPTGLDINWVRCVSPREVYLCANDGGFFRGSIEKWENLSVPGMKEEFWCVEIFGGAIYLAATSGIYMFDGKRIAKVSTKLRPAPDGQRLHANDGVLWSFGGKHLCFFDGKEWTYVKHPDNP